ncbi:MAG: peptidoglycan -binding protein [Alphaproteobacteria bacterium]|nr:MAG: peptidoglycan -binding protein [Alphaproteobacteria bacterium]|tara:strand:+ start:5955 stop:7637 length:1683 start_codon:yes stop_codon:yes gene_type:complete
MLTRRSGERFTANIWPGFVDAMTAILLILMFILSIFMIVQSVLRDTISSQKIELDEQQTELSQLGNNLEDLKNELGMLKSEKSKLQTLSNKQKAQLTAQETELQEKINLLTRLRNDMKVAETKITDFKSQVASLIAKRLELDEKLKIEKKKISKEVSNREAAELALAAARDTISQKISKEKMMAASNEALEQLIQKLKLENQSLENLTEKKASELSMVKEKMKAINEDLTDAEKQRVMEQYAIRNLQENLLEKKEELVLITLTIEEERKKALETLKLLAASREAQKILKEQAAKFEKKLIGNDNILKEKDLALREARLRLSVQEEKAKASMQEVANLTLQTNSLKERLKELTGILDATIEKDFSNNVEIKSLGAKLNAALAKVASEQKIRAQLEEKERKRLETETKNLREYRSVFFGRLKKILGDIEGIDVVGDRFVFSSEVLFDRGSADIGMAGKVQLDTISNVLKDISKKIPKDINWVLRVDGHTDKTPVSQNSVFNDNWELSQARSLSVVKYMINTHKIDPKRMSAAGFGEHQPISFSNSKEALAKNRRIEFKLTER